MSILNELDFERIESELESGLPISMRAPAKDWFYLAMTIVFVMDGEGLPPIFIKPLSAFKTSLIEAIEAVYPDAATVLKEGKNAE